jgi:CSLREA domain-containing protein
MMTRAYHFRMLAIVLAVAVALTLALAFEDSAYSDITFTVNMTSDAVDSNPGDGRCDVDASAAMNQCTLRAAIQEANATSGRDAIDVPPGIYKITREESFLGSGDASAGDLDILDSLDIRGAGSSSTIIDGNRDVLAGAMRVFQIGLSSSGLTPSVEISDVTIQKGGVTFLEPSGIDIQQGSSLRLFRVLVSDNTSTSQGAGIRNAGILLLRESTVDNNEIVNQTGGGVQASGGGILNFGQLDVQRSTISNNRAARGGGIYNANGAAEISNSTISGNRVYGGGGGIVNAGTLKITASTITNNEANRAGSTEQESRRGGGGIQNLSSGMVEMGSTILAGNTNNNPSSFSTIPYAPDCYSISPSTFYSYRDNIVGFVNDQCNMADAINGTSITCCSFDIWSADRNNRVDPKLDPLGNYGGPTKTLRPRADSVAIDADIFGSGETFFDCRPIDQRSATRPADGNGDGTAGCDIGAFELHPPLQVRISNARVTEGNSGTKNMNFTLSLSAPSFETVSVSFFTANGTASAPSDYVAASGGRTFVPGQTAKTISVAVKGDTRREPNETFSVNLWGTTNATIADGVGVGTIVDND